MEKIARQVGGLFSGYDRLYLVVSAQGDTTNRIKARLDGTSVDTAEVFKEFEQVAKDIGDAELRAYRDRVYSEFGIQAKMIQLQGSNGTVRLRPRAHLSGERLAAAALRSVLRSHGIDAGFIDFGNEYPLVAAGGDYLNAGVDLAASRERMARTVQPRLAVLPGYGGVDKKGDYRTFGRGGSDLAAFLAGYAAQADTIVIGTDVDGIKAAAFRNAEGSMTYKETVPEVSIAEAEDGATFGAKFPYRRAFGPLRQMFAEGMEPVVYVADSNNLQGSKTCIVQHSAAPAGVKIVASRDVEWYRVVGDTPDDINGLVLKLRGRNIEYIGMTLVENYHVFAVSANDAEETRRVLDATKKVHVINRDRVALVGTIGHNMAAEEGLIGRAGHALRNAGISVPYAHDISPHSMGWVVERGYKDRAIETLYHEFRPANAY